MRTQPQRLREPSKKLKRDHRRRLAINLALQVGRIDVDQMLTEIRADQFDELMAFNELEPIGDRRLIEVLKLGFTALCHAWEMDLHPNQIDPLEMAKKTKSASAKTQRAIIQHSIG